MQKFSRCFLSHNRGGWGEAVVYYPALGRSKLQYQEALSFGRQKRGSLSTAAPFVLPISFPISSFTCTSQVCVLMTLLPSGSPYFPKDINLLAPLPASSFFSGDKLLLSYLVSLICLFYMNLSSGILFIVTDYYLTSSGIHKYKTGYRYL